MKQQYSHPGDFVKLLLSEIKKTKATLITRQEALAMEAEHIARHFQTEFQAAWTAIEKKSQAPLLEDIALGTTIKQMDLYYAGIFETLDAHNINTGRLRELMREIYAKHTGKNAATLEQEKVMECLDTELSGDWKAPIVYLHDKIDSFFVARPVPDYSRNGQYLTWITPDTTVGEVFDLIIDAVEKTQE